MCQGELSTGATSQVRWWWRGGGGGGGGQRFRYKKSFWQI